MGLLAWALVGLTLTLLGLLLALAPCVFELSARGQGVPDAWALAFGAQWRFVALTGAGGSQAPFNIQLFLFGRSVWARPLEHEGPQGAAAWVNRAVDSFAGEPTEKQADKPSRVWDPPPGAFLWGERKRVRVEELEIHTRYSFADPTVTGRVLGAGYLLTGILPPQITLTQEAVWQFEDRFELRAAGRIKLWPGRLLLDALRYFVKNAIKNSRAERGGLPKELEPHEGK